MKLLLDLGNTRLKWAVLEASGKPGPVQALAWNEIDPGRLHAAWQDLGPVTAVWAAAVADACRQQQVAREVDARWGIRVHWLSSPQQACGVRSAYARVQDLGVDRFLTMVAAHADGLAPCVLASCGTALVLDALDGQGRHLGGLIAPGARLMRQAVLDATAKVRPAAPGRVVDAADDTGDALDSGCWQAAAGLVERFARRMREPLGGAPSLVLTGGDAEVLQPLLEPPSTICPDAVLKGLAVWAGREP